MDYSEARKKFPRAKDIFFMGMRKGYAADEPKQPVVGLPRSKLFSFEDGAYALTDCYWTTAISGYSGGTTLIYHDGSPIWSMRYYGRYDKAVIPFLKKVLMTAYALDVFVAGRGDLWQKGHADGYDVTYRNECKYQSFDDFKGRESITEPRFGRVFGWHEFEGGWLTE